MKRNLFLVLITLCSSYLFSQDSTSAVSIGLTISYELQHNTSNNTEKKITPAATIGIEYAEYKSKFGYRGGVYYTRLKDQDILPYLDYIGDGSGAEPGQIYPSTAILETLDLLLALQIFYHTQDKIRLYGNFGFINSLSFYNNKDYELFGQRYESPNRSLALRTLIGGGVMIQLKEHFGLDVSAGRKILLYTFEDHFIRPYNSFSFQIKLEYIF